MGDRIEEITVTATRRPEPLASASQSIPKKKPVQLENVNVLPNIMDSYENPTYHFRLYMNAPGAPFNNVKQRVVIAESGVSPIDIDEVEIISTGGMTKRAGTGMATNFSFVLREPFGVSLLDQIQRAALFLGIKNFQKFPMYLELSFKGRRSVDIAGGNSTSPADDPLKGLVWTWPIKLTDMAMNVNSGGSTYAIQANNWSEGAHTNQAADMESPIKITTDKVGDFFTQLQQQLDMREAEKKETSGYLFPDTYKFFIDEEIINEGCVPENLEERQNRAGNYSEESNGKMEFTFTPGISIDKIIQNVLSLTKYFQKKALGTTDPDKPGEDRKAEEALYSTLWRVITDVEVGSYDAGRNDYQKHYKYLIIPYDIATIQTKSKIDSTQSDQEIVDTHRKRGILRKVYNYLYTGQNDQVFDFDLSFNFNWHIALPIQGGLSTQITKAEAAAKVTPEQQELNEQLIANYIKKFGGLANDFPAGPLAGFDPFTQLIEMLKSQVDVSSFDNPFAEGIETAQNLQQDVEDVQTQVNDQVGGINDQIGMVQDGIGQLNSAIPGVVQPLLSPAVNGALTALDLLRVPGINQDRLGIGNSSPASARENLREIDYQLDDLNTEEALQKIQVASEEMKSGDESLDGQKYAASPGQTLLSAMFEQAVSPTGRDLINIDLVIKGDPYWLEPTPHRFGTAPVTNFTRALALRGVVPGTNGQGVAGLSESETDVGGTTGYDDVLSVDTVNSQTMIVFRNFTPLEFDPITGITPAGRKSTNVINGVYGVRLVTHQFAGGEFRQTLHGIRDPQISLRNVDLNADIKDNIGGEYLPTVSEVFNQDGSNPSGFSLTPVAGEGIGGALVAVPSTPTGTEGADFFGGILETETGTNPAIGTATSTSPTGATTVAVDDLSLSNTIGNAPVGPTQTTPENDGTQ